MTEDIDWTTIGTDQDAGKPTAKPTKKVAKKAAKPVAKPTVKPKPAAPPKSTHWLADKAKFREIVTAYKDDEDFMAVYKLLVEIRPDGKKNRNHSAFVELFNILAQHHDEIFST